MEKVRVEGREPVTARINAKPFQQLRADASALVRFGYRKSGFGVSGASVGKY
jgi:hypothetical protein